MPGMQLSDIIYCFVPKVITIEP